MSEHSRSLDTAILVHVWIPFRHNGMERKERARIYMKLYGYGSSSNYGKYHYDVKGILDSVPSIRYEDGNFIVRGGFSCHKEIPGRKWIKLQDIESHTRLR